MEKKISVIIGVYNPDEKKLNASVKSIQEQSFKEWEMILYDDGSRNSMQKKYIRFPEEIQGSGGFGIRKIKDLPSP